MHEIIQAGEFFPTFFTFCTIFQCLNFIKQLKFVDKIIIGVSSKNELLQKIQSLSLATMGAGYIELWEWDEISAQLQTKNNTETNTGKPKPPFLIIDPSGAPIKNKTKQANANEIR